MMVNDDENRGEWWWSDGENGGEMMAKMEANGGKMITKWGGMMIMKVNNVSMK